MALTPREQVAQSPPLSPRYYRDNFLTLCRTVQAQYADILTIDELGWLSAFVALPEPAQCLYLRLASRVGPWFRVGRLSYDEIPDLEGALQTLLSEGFAELAGALDVAGLGRLFTRAELRRIFPALLTPPGHDKAADLALIGDWCQQRSNAEVELLAAVSAAGERIVAVTGLARFEVLQLLFFGNRRQSLTDFVLSDLGVARYYPYPLDRAYRQFRERAALEDYLYCAQLADAFEELRQNHDIDALQVLAGQLLEVDVAHAASERRWWRLFNRVARELERAGELTLALALYQRSELPPARERAIRVLEAQDCLAEALARCTQIIAEPRGEEELAAAHRMLPRLQRKLGQRPSPRPKDDFKRIDLTLDLSGQGVELDVAAALADAPPGDSLSPGSVADCGERSDSDRCYRDWCFQDWPFRDWHYVENSLMNGLFGLAFWEQIFSPVEGAFHNPFQAAPTDMYDGRFFSRRRQALEQRLNYLARCNLGAELEAVYRNMEGYQCRWINWRYLPLSLVQKSLAVIPSRHLLAIWQRMLFDPAENRSGFPDLIGLGERSGDYVMIEVKGPGDTLQESQKRWLRFFAEHDIPAGVAWVSRRDIGGD